MQGRKLRAVIEVEYVDDPEHPDLVEELLPVGDQQLKRLRNGLEEALTHAIGCGILTCGADECLVEDYKVSVKEVTDADV